MIVCGGDVVAAFCGGCCVLAIAVGSGGEFVFLNFLILFDGIEVDDMFLSWFSGGPGDGGLLAGVLRPDDSPLCGYGALHFGDVCLLGFACLVV